MPIVYVSQLPMRRDVDTGSFAPAYNLHPATVFGELVICMQSQAPWLTTDDLIPQLAALLAPYSLDAGDCLLTLGDPVVAATACALLARAGPFRVLRWDKYSHNYSPVIIGTSTA